MFHYLQKDSAPPIGMHKSKSKHELKLLEKIPENAEATVVLVGKLVLTNPIGMLLNFCLGISPKSFKKVKWKFGKILILVYPI